MKTRILSSLREIMADRVILSFIFVIGLVSLVYIAYVILSIQPRELQIATHYSAFGETHFYRNKWYYMLSFVAFGIGFAVLHIGLVVKLLRENMRPLAIAFSWMTFLIAGIGFAITQSVLGIAFLS